MEKVSQITNKYSVLCSSLDYKIRCMKDVHFAKFVFYDIFISVFIAMFTIPNLDPIVDEFWRNTGRMAVNLNGTITWLRSNPAGLKLNTPVNETLATFFTYHIYLWTTFIGFLRSDVILRFIINSSLFGLSTFVAVIHDFSQIFFLHFNCFDAYATKLCYLCYYTLTVLWGLVMGKKWNPLRKRTDTVSLDTRQQFLATSLFVILLFIFPTTVVYFVVFRALRWAVSACQWILHMAATSPMMVYKWWYKGVPVKPWVPERRKEEEKDVNKDKKDKKKK